jgi:ribosomal protein S18 acetylase RimI-like enzyme
MALSEARTVPKEHDAGQGLRVDPLTLDDVSGGLALSDAAGWNQTADDWALFIGEGRAIGFRDGTGRLVATAAALPYGDDTGWISMVLVAEAWRHRGLASALLRECVAHLQALGVTPVLDATPAGAAVYRGLGFAAGFAFERWQSGTPFDIAIDAKALRAAEAMDGAAIVPLDRAASGSYRRGVLENFLARPATRAWLGADGRSFVIARAGRRATQVGPLVAPDAGQAIALLSAALASAGVAEGERIFLDVPESRRDLVAWLERHGFTRQRSFVRMSLGAAHPPALGEGACVLAGPEFG